MNNYVIGFDRLRMTDVDQVGGKNASLGEMISQLAHSGVRVPGGFATTAQAYRDFLAHDGLAERIAAALEHLDIDDVNALAACGAQIRQWIIDTPFPAKLNDEIEAAYRQLVADSTTDMSFAVRSSATAEDLPDASFAGQQETFLNIEGLPNILHAMKEVFASLYNDRAISYRVHKGFIHADVALSAGVQRMVRSDTGAAGVMFTLDTESGFRDAVFVTSSYGLGETVVQGAVNPDEFYVHKPMLAAGKQAVIRRNLGSKLIKMVFSAEKVAGKSVTTVDVAEAERNRFSLNDAEVQELAFYAMTIEQHYGRPMDIEWGKDGRDGNLYVLQARPETVKSQESHGGSVQKFKLKTYSKVLASGRAIGQKIGVGPVRVVHDPREMDKVQPGDVLVADMTDPNWEPVMKRASAIVTNRGGRTCHAAIIARELGIPAIVGCGDATGALNEGEIVTASCAEGDTGHVYRGKLEYEITSREIAAMPEIPVKIMMNVGNPELAFEFSQLPNAGVGLARVEFIINNVIGVHPKAILDIDRQTASHREEIERRARGYASPKAFFVEKLVEGVATIAAVGEGAAVEKLLAEHGLKRGENGLRLIMMCEIPSNALLAEDFLDHFDGMSIGSNDLTQLTLGLDRDSGLVAALFDERDPAVKTLLAMAIAACRKHGKYVGICGQGPSDHPDLAEWLMDQGIGSISLNPDTVVDTWTRLAAHKA
ncbi:MAG: phosphoenolpyruvate synthase [Betaproteobacteria bacterium]|nr:phosphoenolpyruvate synthase [Betaproteobacteria bacterium]